jgi:hypothetical protein
MYGGLGLSMSADTEFSHINLIGEAATVLLLGLAVLILRKGRICC